MNQYKDTTTPANDHQQAKNGQHGHTPNDSKLTILLSFVFWVGVVLVVLFFVTQCQLEYNAGMAKT